MVIKIYVKKGMAVMRNVFFKQLTAPPIKTSIIIIMSNVKYVITKLV